MQIQINKDGMQERSATVQQPAVVISQNLKRESVTLDKSGNIIDPRNKQIINSNEDNQI